MLPTLEAGHNKYKTKIMKIYATEHRQSHYELAVLKKCQNWLMC